MSFSLPPSRARGAELGQRRVHQREAGLAQLIGFDRGVAEHAGPMQYFAGAQRLHLWNRRAHFALEIGQALQQLGIERKLLAGGRRRRETDAAIELAAADLGGDQFAQTRFERAQLLDHAKLDVEKAVVDAFQLEKKRALRSFARQRRITGHALNHVSPCNCGFVN